ncbi:MAG: hypothetical protein J5785_01385 [Spirochaetales bacterium]|nr:hypothetical protein [Spirochaetales bacterium]
MTLRKALLILLIAFCASMCLWAEPITFSGGSTSIRKQGEDLTVTLSGGAVVQADGVKLTADEISISGENSRIVKCSGTVKAVREENKLTLLSPELTFDRKTQLLLVDSWVQIQLVSEEVALSGARLQYNMETGLMILQIQARILKVTDKGLLSCQADSITYDSKNGTLRLEGRCSVSWGSDEYQAAVITIDLNTEELRMEGRITGTVNG